MSGKFFMVWPETPGRRDTGSLWGSRVENMFSVTDFW